MRRLRLLHSALKLHNCRIVADKSSASVNMQASKKEKNRCIVLAGFEAPNKIQLGDR